ncbi:MAG: lysylphosphatidylglycerol synthase domain-containing protein [bacterium]
MLPVATFAESLENFLDAASTFFSSLAAISWSLLGWALLFYTLMIMVRSRAWQNTLKAAYPSERVTYSGIAASNIAGFGVNAILPARIGDAVKVVLAKETIERSSFAAIFSSFLVQGVFDTVVGLLLVLFVLSRGLVTPLPELPNISAFDLSFWAANPTLRADASALTALVVLVLLWWIGRHVRNFMAHLKQGAIILTTPRRFIREVVSWQALGWVFRLASVWLMLAAFNVETGFEPALVATSVQTVSQIVPFTPGGAGAQQALLVAAFADSPDPTAELLSYSVGQQVTIVVWGALLAFAAVLIVFRTVDWRSILGSARERKAER